jgi:polar amino acid transport system substrate-binding protein
MTRSGQRDGRKWGAAACLALALCLSPAARADDDDESLSVAVAEFPPGFVSEPDGKVSGLAVPIVTSILREAGYDTDLHIYPVGRVHALIEEGSVDVSIGTRYFDPDGAMLFTETPFSTIWIALFSREDSPPVDSLAKLNGKNVIVPFGQSTPLAMVRQAAPNAHILQPRTHENALHMLRSGRADYLLDWRDPIVTLITQRKEHFRRFDMPAQHTYFVVSRRRKDAETVVKRLDEAMKRIAGADGTQAR